MYRDFFDEFLMSHDTLRVYDGNQLIFSSVKDRLLPLLEYIEQFPRHQQVVIFDKILGNAAALLAVKAGCRAVYSPLGSRFAIDTLDRHHIVHHITNVVPCIRTATLDETCPMEKLSVGKDAETFYAAVKNLMSRSDKPHVTSI